MRFFCVMYMQNGASSNNLACASVNNSFGIVLNLSFSRGEKAKFLSTTDPLKDETDVSVAVCQTQQKIKPAIETKVTFFA